MRADGGPDQRRSSRAWEDELPGPPVSVLGPALLREGQMAPRRGKAWLGNLVTLPNEL